jgi:DNA polymerase I-like protein with 3'-5' exonuclease and polymerase domains
VNYLIQGTTADLVKERMNHVVRALRLEQSKVLVQIHDELLCKIHSSEEKDVVPLIVKTLEENEIIPLKVDVALCTRSWADKAGH